ncbi:unnamed protein product [Blepharisma stoltei]|uniref:phosphatidate phosphatase n=1 Tax=Blepharisma stoltei TaxID=1481888 RepID=A0AAU9JL61_9CILI|nr:unnamed protein product [Blepharisma stoltei]
MWLYIIKNRKNMSTLGKFFTNLSSAMSMNKATLSGALDVIVIQHPDDSFHATPFHVRFGRLKLLKSSAKTIKVYINGKQTHIRMKLDEEGEAYFVEPSVGEIEENLKCSPISSPKLIKGEKTGDSSPIKVEESLGPVRKSGAFERLRVSKLFIGGQILPMRGDDCEEVDPGEDLEPSTDNYESDGNQVDISLCGDLVKNPDTDLEEIFIKHRIPFSEFKTNPWAVINDPRLMIKIDNKLYGKEEGIPLVLALLIYKQSLNDEESYIVESPKKEFEVQRPADTTVYKKSIMLDSDSLRSLGLKGGSNDITYIVESKLQGMQSIQGKIYLWDSSCKIVISDVDGTITKSDVLGQLLPIIGKDWSHPGVVNLYNDITANGYKILYLSSRAIGQAPKTKEYLASLRENNRGLPEGPVILSPDRLFKSFVREVIKREPQNFKTPALTEVLTLFPEDVNPFYAGFGNRDTDAIAYRAVGIPMDRIFIINPVGKIFVFDNSYINSYPELNAAVSEKFPLIVC